MKDQKTVAIVGNGTLSPSLIEQMRQADIIVGVDYAAYWLLECGVIPDVAIGDFDSVTKVELAVIKEKVKKVESFPPEKDCTDMELAIEYANKLHPTEIIIYGGVGSRLDHSMGNILLLSRYVDRPCDIRLVNETNECRVIKKNTIVQKTSRFGYVSLLSLTDDSVVTLHGFKYDIAHHALKRGETIGISNEIQGERGKIVVHKGIVLLVRSRD